MRTVTSIKRNGRDALSQFPGLKVVDDPASKQYPMPLTATSQFDVEVRLASQSNTVC